MNHKDHKDHKENRSTCLVSGIIVVAMTAWLAAGSSDSPVADAAKQGDRETVRSLLKHGVDVNAAQGDGTTALHWAARQGNVELAQMLLYAARSEEHTSELQSRGHLVCRLLPEKKKSFLRSHKSAEQLLLVLRPAFGDDLVGLFGQLVYQSAPRLDHFQRHTQPSRPRKLPVKPA